MFRNAVIAAAAVLAIGTVALPTGASARGGHGFGGHGFHGGYHGGFNHGGYGGGWRGARLGIGFYNPYVYSGAYDSCFQVRRIATPYGWRLRRVYVCG